ncbi:MAG: 30S ribosomal protein S20 [Elusimicrobiota bacterium]|jgi:small subunit ribosomal protein S20|nr:30S ribosomal protein S20 [Elusimicrobiota bacterium]
MAKLKTGRHTSSLKEARKAKKRTDRNVSVKSKIKTIIKKTKAAAANKDLPLAQDLLKSAFSELDKAAKKNVIHYKAAANKKARLSKAIAKAQDLAKK